MKKAQLLIAIFFLTTLAFSQSTDSEKNYLKGSKELDKKNYHAAISLFDLSIEENPTANAYFNRAVAYYYLGDSCSFCNGLIDASLLNDSEAKELYKSKCMFKTKDYNIPDSLKECQPPILYLEVLHHKCLPDTSILFVQNFGSINLPIELEDFKCLTVEEYALQKEKDENTYVVVESMPEYPGGMGELMNFLGQNIRYPAEAKKLGIEGRVYVHFVIETDGRVTEVKVLRGIGGGCDEEAVRVVSLMPKWKPGTQWGEQVRVAYNLPVKFSLGG